MAYLKPMISMILACLLMYTATALNIYISKEHLSDYYQNSDISMLIVVISEITIFLFADTKVEVVHSKMTHVSLSGHLMFHNGTDLPPFPDTVNTVTFTWLTGKEEEVKTLY